VAPPRRPRFPDGLIGLVAPAHRLVAGGGRPESEKRTQDNAAKKGAQL